MLNILLQVGLFSNYAFRSKCWKEVFL